MRNKEEQLWIVTNLIHVKTGVIIVKCELSNKYEFLELCNE